MSIYEKNVLIIDDNEDNLFILERIINSLKQNIKVFDAINGEMGIDIFKNKNIDIVICDYQMPGLNGIETLQQMFKLNKNKKLRTFILTADTNCEAKEIENNIFFYGVFFKPIKPEYLKTLLA